MRLHIFLTGLLATALVACGGGSSSPSAGGPSPTAQTVQAAGTVVDEQGVPLAGAKVTVVSNSTVAGTDSSKDTDSNGQFTLTLDAATPAVLRFCRMVA